MNDEYRTLFERKLIHHCTPTLAALKPANLFTFRLDQLPEDADGDAPDPDALFRDALRDARNKLAPQGVRIEVLARRETGMLLYVYRPRLVKHILGQERVAAFLREEGYDPSSLSSCIERLHRRICGTDLESQLTGSCAFPHEIGFFLGYPYDDVIGFIENKGENFLCCGCWKVYSRERDAQDCFCRYKDCTALYESLYEEGASLESLAAVKEDARAVASLSATVEGLRAAAC